MKLTNHGQNISLADIPHHSPEKKHTQRQITAVNTHINTINNSIEQSNQLHT